MKTLSGGLLFCIIRHPLTTVTLFGSKKNGPLMITGVQLAVSSLFRTKSGISGHKALLIYAESISMFLDGNQHDLSGIPVDLSWCTPFTKKVLSVARMIPWGRTISYAELARRSRNERAVRAAASVMRNNRFPLIIPCHRVIKSNGSPGGFMGKQKGEEIDLKQLLIDLEKTN